jgi:hypothetical protein
MRKTCLFLLFACSPADSADTDDTGGSDTGDVGTTTVTGGAGETEGTPGDPDVLVGSFQVQLIAATDASPAKTAVLGKIYDGPTPPAVVWEQADERGDCRLMTPRVPFCSTPCGGSAVCVEDDTCEPYPAAHGAGTVTLGGVRLTDGGASFAMDPINNTYQPGAGVTLEYPAFDEGAEVTLAAAGDYFHAFELAAAGVRPLELADTALALAQDTPLDLEWTAGSVASARIRVKLDISHHGGTRGMITCEAADTGALTIDGGLIGRLLDLGVAGFPTIIVTRESIGAVTIAPGRVELVLSSSLEHAVDVPGVESCTADDQCPAGQTCQPDLTCQ